MKTVNGMKSLMITCVIILILIPCTMVGAAGPDWNPGVRFGEWLDQNIKGVFPGLIGAIAVFFLVKRQVAAFIGFACFALVVALFVFSPDMIKNIGTEFGGWLFGN
jgi:hypothetical protein